MRAEQRMYFLLSICKHTNKKTLVKPTEIQTKHVTMRNSAHVSEDSK